MSYTQLSESVLYRMSALQEKISDLMLRDSSSISADVLEFLNNEIQRLEQAISSDERVSDNSNNFLYPGYWEMDIQSSKLLLSRQLVLQMEYGDREMETSIQWFTDKIHPEDKPEAIQKFDLVLKHKIEKYENIFRLQTKTGRWIWVQQFGRAVSLSENKRLYGIQLDINAFKRGEEALKNSEEKMSAIFKAMPDHLFILNREGVILNCHLNEHRAKAYNFKTDHFIGKSIDNLLEAELLTKVKNALLSVLECNKIELIQGKVKINDITKNFEGRFVCYQTDKILVVVRDISEEIINKGLILDQKEQIEAVASLLPEVVFETNLDGKLTFVNVKAFEKFEYLPEDFEKGLYCLDMIVASERLKAAENIKKMLLGEAEKKGLEYTAISKTGRLFPVRIFSSRIFKRDKLVGLRGIIIDISVEKETKSSLHYEQEKFMQLAENSNEAFYIRDLSKKLLYVNQGFETIFKRSRNEILENPWNLLKWTHPDDVEMLKNLIDLVYEEKKKAHQLQFRIIRGDGQIRWIWARTFPILDQQGNIFRIAGIGADVTEQVTLLEELKIAKNLAEKQDMQKSVFLSNLSHELRTPLNSILGFIELLESTDLSELDSKKYVGIIKKSGFLLLQLLNDIIDISKIETGQITIEKTKFLVNALLEDIQKALEYNMVKMSSPEVEIILKVPANSSDIELFTDKTRLQQILTNLLVNAIKFTPKGCIEFGYILNKPGEIQFYVFDNGIGIPKDKQETIFNRFYQLDKNQCSHKGYGLGLTITKGLINLIGGNIWLESEPGSGTKFYFTLPYFEINQNVGETPLDNKIQNEFKWDNKNILIVEDDDINRLFLQEVLKKTKAKTKQIYNGEKAIEECLAQNYDLILMDIGLPGINGFEATRRIREFNPQIPIVAQTAYAMLYDKEKCLKSGFNAYISKPVNRIKLLETLSELFENSNINGS